MYPYQEVRVASTHIPKHREADEIDKSFSLSVAQEMYAGFVVIGAPYIIPETDKDYARICVLMVKNTEVE